MAKKDKEQFSPPATIDDGSVSDDPPEYFLVYGDPLDNSRQHIYSRYAMGDSLKQIAIDCSMEVAEVMAVMRQRPAEYKETREKREIFERLRVQRSLNLCDAINLGLLEWAHEHKSVTLDKDFMSHLSKIVKDLANRHALNEGKATVNIGITEILTDEVMRERLKAQDEAGHGLAVDDIGGAE